MRTVCAGIVVIGLSAAAWALYAAAAEKGDNKVDTRVFELRTYHVVPGRMKAMNARFRDHTNKLLEKHGMTLVGFWQPEGKDAETTLIYLVAHKSREAADKSWKTFRDDPEWLKVKADSEKDGKIVEKVDTVFMNPTDYSALK